MNYVISYFKKAFARSQPKSRHRLRSRVKLDDRILAAGEWLDGQILLNRADIRYFAAETGESVQRVLYDTAYHEAFHGFVEPVGRLVSRILGTEDIYQASLDAMNSGLGWGYWYRAEE